MTDKQRFEKDIYTRLTNIQEHVESALEALDSDDWSGLQLELNLIHSDSNIALGAVSGILESEEG